jgi:hypothetical protein
MSNIINTLNTQLQDLARETVLDMLIECPLEELKTAVADCMAGEYIDDLINADNSYFEAFYYFDTYYAETAGRGDTGEVCEAVRDALDEEFGSYIYEEADQLEELEGVYRANWFVNLYAECMATNVLPYDYEEVVNEAIAQLEA